MQINTPTIVATDATASQLSQSTLYSASAGGKTYPADVALAGGEYVATVHQLPGISASGSTLLAAENNLNARISVLA